MNRLSQDPPRAIRGNFIPVSFASSRPPSSGQVPHHEVGLHLHINMTDAQMDRLAHALPPNCSPHKSQRRQYVPDVSGTPPSPAHAGPNDRAMSPRPFLTLADSARARRAASPPDHGRHGSGDAHDAVELFASAHDAIMSSHEPHSHLESSRGRRTPAPVHHDHHGHPSARQGASSSSRARSSRSRSPAKRCRSPDKASPIPRSTTAESLAERRHGPRPSAINTDAPRHQAPVSKKTVIFESNPAHRSHQAAIVAAPPSTPPLRSPLRRMPRIPSPPISESGEDESSSYYSEEDFGQAHPSYISPLRVRKDVVERDNNGVLRSYSVWGKSSSPQYSPERMVYSPTTHAVSPPRDAYRGLQKTATTGDLRQSDSSHQARNYSPLSDYLSSRTPVHKEMVGRHGWLERTNGAGKEVTSDRKNAEQQQQQQQQQPQKKEKKGFLNSLKKIAKDLTSDITASASRTKVRGKDSRVSRLTVSLDPREQSLLYCELEFLLTTALDSYVNSQFNAGRLDADKYKKIVDGWQQRGRPKVIGFRYDLETQLDLVLLHSEEFRFYGKRAGLLAAVNGVLDMMRVDARAMRIRTFCQPDTVVAKQLLDAQSLFNLIGCSEQQQIQLAEVIQFFKVILEREQNYRIRDEEANRPAEEEPQWRGSNGTGTDSQAKKSHSSKNSASGPTDPSF